eukprot:m.345039 g.345039  ORF g.345039 m.345039 type:complete len:65 (+) comp20652_c0_seq2:1597-1791(+)
MSEECTLHALQRSAIAYRTRGWSSITLWLARCSQRATGSGQLVTCIRVCITMSFFDHKPIMNTT